MGFISQPFVMFDFPDYKTVEFLSYIHSSYNSGWLLANKKERTIQSVSIKKFLLLPGHFKGNS